MMNAYFKSLDYKWVCYQTGKLDGQHPNDKNLSKQVVFLVRGVQITVKSTSFRQASFQKGEVEELDHSNYVIIRSPPVWKQIVITLICMIQT